MNRYIKYVLIFLISSLYFLPLLAPADDTSSVGNLRINEIMYNLLGSDADREWIEIINTGSKSVEILTGSSSDALRIIDGTNRRVLGPSDIVLNSGEYLIVAKNIAEFMEEHLNFSSKILQAAIDFGNSTDTVGLAIGSNREPRDSITYENLWGANGNDKSLEKINPNLLNEQTNWKESSNDGGTPGKQNSNFTNNSPVSATLLEPQNGDSINAEQVDFSWNISNDAENNPVYYNFELATDLGFINQVFQISTSDTSTNFILDNGSYFWRIQSCDVFSCSDYSETCSFIFEKLIILPPPEPVYGNSIRINELLPDPASPLKDADDEAIELYNYGDLPVNLEDWKLQDLSVSIIELKADIVCLKGKLILEPKQYLVIYSNCINISLNNEGDIMSLYDPSGNLVGEKTPNYGK
ncbi:MAG: lamin tail domain-containing protein, partial [bacterium]